MSETRMRNTLHANLGNGGYRYEYEDGLGNRCTAIRAPRGKSERTFWTHDLLPEQEFPDYATMNVRLLALTREDIALEQDKYPRLAPIERDTCGNRCQICPRSPSITFPPPKHETWRIELATNWQRSWYASLCGVHREEFEGKPQELLDALKSEVAARKARAVGFGSTLGDGGAGK